MLIKYTGPKPVKVVEYNGFSCTFIAEEEGQDPVCEVKDPITLKYLLGADMKGLFVPATSGTAKAEGVEQKDAENAKKEARDLAAKVRELIEEKRSLKAANGTLTKKVKALEKELKSKK